MKSHNTLFVNTKSKKVIVNRTKNEWITKTVIDTVNFQFGSNRAETMTPFSSLSKELKALGFDSQESRGKFIRKRIRDTLATTFTDTKKCLFAIRIHGNKMQIAITDITRNEDRSIFGDVFIFDISLGDHMNIVVKTEFINRNGFSYTGNTMTHHVDAEKIENRGKYVRKVDAVINNKSTLGENNTATEEIIEVVNHNATILDETSAFMAFMMKNDPSLHEKFEAFKMKEESMYDIEINELVESL